MWPHRDNQVVHGQKKPSSRISMGRDFGGPVLTWSQTCWKCNNRKKQGRSEGTWSYMSWSGLAKNDLPSLPHPAKATTSPFFFSPTRKALRISARRFFSFSSLLTTISRAATAHSPAKQQGFSNEDKNRFDLVFSPCWIKASEFASCQHMSTCAIDRTCVAALKRTPSEKFHSPKQIYILASIYIQYQKFSMRSDQDIDSRPGLVGLDGSWTNRRWEAHCRFVGHAARASAAARHRTSLHSSFNDHWPQVDILDRTPGRACEYIVL